jgi:hypothetical protein
VNVSAPEPFTRHLLPLCLGLMALLILGAVAAGLWAERNAPTVPIAQRVPPAQAAKSRPPAAAASVALQEVEREEDEPSDLLTDAFEAATGHRKSFDVKKDGDAIAGVWPEAIIQLPFGKALLVGKQNLSRCHYCQGSFDIYYFRQEGGKIVSTGRWPRAVLGWDWGNPPENWRVTTRFTTYPAIVAWGDFMQHGIILRSSTLTEMRPDGAVMSDVIGMGFDDKGFHDDPRRACTVNGKVMNVRKDVGFDVQVTGTVRKIERYRKSGVRFVSISPVDWQEPCRS